MSSKRKQPYPIKNFGLYRLHEVSLDVYMNFMSRITPMIQHIEQLNEIGYEEVVHDWSQNDDDSEDPDNSRDMENSDGQSDVDNVTDFRTSDDEQQILTNGHDCNGDDSVVETNNYDNC